LHYHLPVSLITESLVAAEYGLSRYYMKPSMFRTAICISATCVYKKSN